MFRFVNNLKTTMLLALLMSVFMIAGNAFFPGGRGLVIALILGGGMNIIVYFFSDKIALTSMRSQQVTEKETPQLIRMVEDLSAKAFLPTPRVYICPQDSPNAFATGRNPNNAAVAVTKGILEMLDTNELRGVIGHELAHIKHRDILISSVAATIAGAISALGYMLWFIPIGGDRRSGNPLPAIAMIILAPIAAALIQMAISRKREFNADHYGAELSGDPMYLATALEKLHLLGRRRPMKVAMDSQKSMFIVAPFSGKDAMDLFNTHPSLKKRLTALIGQETTGLVR